MDDLSRLATTELLRLCARLAADDALAGDGGYAARLRAVRAELDRRGVTVHY
jgi:hypothetical protein